jgi:hypothetical protein
MQFEHEERVKKLTEARDKLCSDTMTWLRFDEAIAKENRDYRAECVRLGIIPQNLALVSRTEYVYRSFVAHEDKPKEHNSPNDEAIRKALDEEYSK